MTEARQPLELTPARRLAEADAGRHMADLVRLVLLTGPGERLHHPDFGAGLGASALFDPLDATLAGVVEARIRSSLETALADRIEVLAVSVVRSGEAELAAAVTYRETPAGDAATTEVRSGA